MVVHCPQFITIGPGSVSLETMERDVFDPQEMKLSRKPIGPANGHHQFQTPSSTEENFGLHQIGANPCLSKSWAPAWPLVFKHVSTKRQRLEYDLMALTHWA